MLDELGGRIPLIIDGGRTTLGIESTVVAVHNGEIEVLRRGPITAEQLRHVAPVTFAGSSNRPKAPGQLATHYAPATPLRLVTDASAIRLPTGKRCGLLAYHATETTRFVEIRRLSPNIDVAAADLFRLLRELDQARLDLIVAEEVPEIGIGSAINSPRSISDSAQRRGSSATPMLVATARLIPSRLGSDTRMLAGM